MRITAIREDTVSIASSIKNAYIDFSKMTVSVLALETDVVRDGRPVVGYGFNSNGRYAQGGLLRDRFIPRLMAAAPEQLLDETGENLFSHQDVVNLLRYGGMRPDRDYLQMDPVLSYGLVEYLLMLEALKRHGWSPRRCIPHGGHQFALHIAAGLGLAGNESYPGIFAPFGGFADSTPVENGRIRLTECPGIGFEEKAALMDVLWIHHR
jgi:L-alanine-DL-glutamate epimerase-like enolase superfamily enzyme